MLINNSTGLQCITVADPPSYSKGVALLILSQCGGKCHLLWNTTTPPPIVFTRTRPGVMNNGCVSVCLSVLSNSSCICCTHQMCENVTICKGCVPVVMTDIIYSKSQLLCRKGKCVLNMFPVVVQKKGCPTISCLIHYTAFECITSLCMMCHFLILSPFKVKRPFLTYNLRIWYAALIDSMLT